MAVAAKPNESEIIKRQCEVVPERYTNCSGISSACLRETLSVLCGKLETKRRDRRGFRRGTQRGDSHFFFAASDFLGDFA